MVAGQDAQAARGNRQRLVKAELGGEIRDGILEQLRRVLVAPGGFARSRYASKSRSTAARAVAQNRRPAGARAVRIPTPRAGWRRRCGKGSASRAGTVPGTNPAPPGPRSTRGCGTVCSGRRPVPFNSAPVRRFLRHRFNLLLNVSLAGANGRSTGADINCVDALDSAIKNSIRKSIAERG